MRSSFRLSPSRRSIVMAPTDTLIVADPGLVRWTRLMSESGCICLPAYEPVPSNYAWRLQSIGAIALSIEVPFILGRQDPHQHCVHEVFFKAQSCHRWLTFQRQFSMSAMPVRRVK